jgi:hypothetical protein
MRMEQAARHLGVNTETFRYWKSHEGLPFHRMADACGLTLYLRSELDLWVRHHDTAIRPPSTWPRPPRRARYRPRTPA